MQLNQITVEPSKKYLWCPQKADTAGMVDGNWYLLVDICSKYLTKYLCQYFLFFDDEVIIIRKMYNLLLLMYTYLQLVFYLLQTISVQTLFYRNWSADLNR